MFAAVSIFAVGFIFIKNVNSNILIGKWQTRDNKRIYIFDDNTLTISSAVNDYSELYGYYLKDKTTLVIQKGEKTEYYSIQLSGSEIAICSEESDSPEIIHRI